MNELESATWVDVTELLGWRGHMTGIQRVVFEYLRRLESDPAVSARGFTYDAGADDLVEVSITAVLDALVEVTATEPGPAPAARVWATPIMNVLRDAYTRTPRAITSRIRNRDIERLLRLGVFGFKTVNRAVGLARSFGRTVELVLPEKPQAAVFLPGDTIFIPGRPWESLRAFELVTRRRQHEDLQLVTLVYDMIPIVHPEFFGPGLLERYASFTFEAIASSDALVCISQSTERDLHAAAAELGFIDMPPTSVIELGDPTHQDVLPERPAFVHEDEPFILSVGSVEGRKNHALLYQAWSLASEQGIELPRLVIVGSPGWLAHDLQYALANDPAARDRITMHDGVPDGELAWLYDHCLFTVFPSIYEGWGLPIAESLRHGKACIASHASSMPEVGDDLVDYISPYSAAEAVDAIRRLLQPEELKTRTGRIANEYRPRDWDASYAHLRDLLALSATMGE